MDLLGQVVLFPADHWRSCSGLDVTIASERVQAGLDEVFREVFSRGDITLRPELTAADVPGWDSFKQVEIIMATEERFAMRFTSAEVDRFRCLGDLMAVVAARGRD